MTDIQSVRVTRLILEHLEGTGAWQQDGHPYDPEELSLMKKLQDAPRRKDRSVTVKLTYRERVFLAEHVEVEIIGAQDNIGSYPEALGEYNACRAMLNRLYNTGVERIW